FLQVVKSAPKIIAIKVNDFLDKAVVSLEVSGYKAAKRAKKEITGAAKILKKNIQKQKPPIAPSQIVAAAGNIAPAPRPGKPIKPKPSIVKPKQPGKKTNGGAGIPKFKYIPPYPGFGGGGGGGSTSSGNSGKSGNSGNSAPAGGSESGGQPESENNSPPTQSDTTPPAAPIIISPADFSQIFTSPDIVFSGTAEASSTISTDFNSATTSVDSNGAWSLALSFNQGSTTVDFFSADPAGNISSSTEVSLFVDSEAPDVSLAISECSDSLSSEVCLVATTTLNISWSSSAADLSFFSVNDNGAFSTTTATSTTVVDGGDDLLYSFGVSACDIAGNCSATSTRAVEISTMPVVINEVAWMGTGSNATTSKDEWIELYNRTTGDIDISGWRLFSSDNGPDIVFGQDSKNKTTVNSVIPAKGYYLIERTDDNDISDISADWFGSFGNGLNDYGEFLTLSRASTTIDKTSLRSNGKWSGGSKYSRYTMERYDPNVSGGDVSNWGTNNSIIKNGKNVKGNRIFGTPKARNSINYLVNKGREINSDITLTKENSPYLVDNNIQNFQSGAVLKIEPGVVVKFYNDAGWRFIGNSKIIARGTESEPIVFTSFYDDEYGGDMSNDATSTSPNPGNWYGIKIKSGDGSLLEHTIFRYGGKYYSGGPGLGTADLTVEDCSLSVSDSVFERSEVYGLKLFNSGSSVSNNNFRNNNAVGDPAGYDGAVFVLGGAPAIKNNIFKGNARGIVLGGSKALVDSNLFDLNSREAIYSFNSPENVFINNSGENNTVNGILLSGDITIKNSTTTLEINKLPYVMNDFNVGVVASSTLVVPAGIILKASAAGLNVFGNLIVEGENAGDITFTSFYDDSVGGDTNNDATSTAPGAGQWKGIWMKPGSYSDIRGAAFKYADTALIYENSPINLENVEFFSNNATTTLK
ncbi:MAG TPA: hypothetical protein ENG99_00865, partial [bacterium]|nr:hypothetical protein [bacterium]